MKSDLNDALVFGRHRQRHVHEWVKRHTDLATLLLRTHQGASNVAFNVNETYP